MSNQPKTWKHKETGKIVRVVPWWECEDPIMGDEKYTPNTADVGTHQTEGHKFKIGTIIQVGWLMENPNGCWIGMGMGLSEFFDEVTSGEAKKNRKRRVTRSRKKPAMPGLRKPRSSSRVRGRP